MQVLKKLLKLVSKLVPNPVTENKPSKLMTLQY